MEQILAEIFRLTALNKTKSNDLNRISGKTPLIIKEKWAFSNLAGIFPSILIKQSEINIQD
jgi:hypothetical protein